MKVTVLAVGPIQANCYLVSDGTSPDCLIVDPGGEADRVLACCEQLGVQPRLIVLTHGHVDHMAAAATVKAATGAPVLIHAADREFVENPHPYWVQLVGGAEPVAVDADLTDGQVLSVGALSLRVLHTPGHSPGSVCLLTDGALFTGDTLFAGSVGRTDLPGGSLTQLEASLRRLLAETTPDTVVYAGHGPQSTMGEEADTNPWLE